MKPSTFLGVAGTKIFRDDIFGRLRFPFLADHRAYRKYRMYDFPQNNYKDREVGLVMMLLTKIPSMRKEIYNNRIKIESGAFTDLGFSPDAAIMSLNNPLDRSRL